MRTACLLLLATSLVAAAPVGVRSALQARQDNSGSTSTMVTGNGGLVNLGSAAAAAAEDGQSTSSTSSSSCNLLECSSGSSAAGPHGTDADASSTSVLDPVTGLIYVLDD